MKRPPGLDPELDPASDVDVLGPLGLGGVQEELDDEDDDEEELEDAGGDDEEEESLLGTGTINRPSLQPVAMKVRNAIQQAARARGEESENRCDVFTFYESQGTCHEVRFIRNLRGVS